jgi:anaerobic selenocysteine-containing dehydrogenase
VRELFPHPYRKSFDTPSGKALFASKPLAQLGFNPYPEWHPPLESKLQTPEFFSKYPFTLASGTTVRHKTSLGEDEVLINTQDARDQGIQEGMDVWIESKVNKVKRKAVISEDIAQGVVFAVQSLSALIPASEGKANRINRLIDDQNNDPIAGAPRFNEMLVKVYPA